MLKSAISGLDTISTSSEITIGLFAVPSFSSATVAGGMGNLAFRQVACRARQARLGANDEVDETVEIEEIDEAREDRDRSDIIDSGLERAEVALAIDGRRDGGGRLSLVKPPGNVSKAHRLKPACWAMAMAEDIDGRREPQALTAGVLEATDDGVSCGVGSGPNRAKAGVGGAMSGFGSRNRGSTVSGVGVLS